MVAANNPSRIGSKIGLTIIIPGPVSAICTAPHYRDQIMGSDAFSAHVPKLGGTHATSLVSPYRAVGQLRFGAQDGIPVVCPKERRFEAQKRVLVVQHGPTSQVKVRRAIPNEPAKTTTTTRRRCGTSLVWL